MQFHSIIIIFFEILLIAQMTIQHGIYQDQLPNGYNVPCPNCAGVCAGIGHINDDGSPGCNGGEHPNHYNNQFGIDFQAFNFNWTRGMCLLDSDKDGLTNGDELGDPCCIWSPGSEPQRGIGFLSHPGVGSATVNVKSCAKGAPSISLQNVTADATSLSILVNTNSTCICRVFMEITNVPNSLTQISFFDSSFSRIIITGLNDNTTYPMRLYVGNHAGNFSIDFDAQTAEVSSQAPSSPASLSTSFAGPQDLLISWATVSGATYYQLDTLITGSVFRRIYNGSETSFLFSGLKPLTSYTFRIRAGNNFGVGSASNLQTFNTTSTPAPTSSASVTATVHQHNSSSSTGGGGTNGFQVKLTPHHTPVAGSEVPFVLDIKSPTGVPVPWSSLLLQHERKLHVVFLSSDLDIFGHAHPEDFTASPPALGYEVDFTFPKWGTYYALINFQTAITGQTLDVFAYTQVQVQPDSQVTRPALGSIANSVPNSGVFRGFPWQGPDRYVKPISFSDNSTLSSGQTEFIINLVSNKKIEAGACVNLVFEVRFKSNNSPVTNLMKYLGVASHVAIANENFASGIFMHEHGLPVSTAAGDNPHCDGHVHSEPPATFGPFIQLEVIFPAAGTYQIFPAFNFNSSQVIVGKFRVTVEASSVVPLLPGDVKSTDYPNHISVLDNQLQIYWKIEGNNVLNMALTSSLGGWVGVGFDPEDSGMKNCDMIMGWPIANGGVAIADMWSTGESLPAQDTSVVGTNDILEFAGHAHSDSMILKFRRKLNTGDSRDKIVSDRLMKLVYAIHSSSSLVTHGPKNRGSATVNLLSGDVEEIDSDRKKEEMFQTAHSVLMVISWVFCVTIAIGLAQVKKFTWWFPAHIFFNTLAVILCIIAFIIGIMMTDNDFVQTDKLILTHSWLGLLVFILSILQPVIGYLADRLYNPDRKEVPIWPDKIHRVIGQCALIGAIFNIGLGMLYLDVKLIWWILLVIWIVIQVVVYYYLKWFYSKHSETSSQEMN